jgi:hypothetical protein
MAADYPTAAEVVTRLALMGVTLSTGNVAPFLSGAVSTWEALTYSPFKASGTPTDYALDPGGAQERLLPTAFVDISSVAVGGVTLASSQYRLLPRSGGPLTRIEFVSPIIEGVNSVVVTGLKGYSTTIPDEVYEAVMNLTVAKARDAQNSGSGLLSKVKQDTVEYTYDVANGQGKVSVALKEMERLAQRYGPAI